MTNKVHQEAQDLSNDLHRKIVNISPDGFSTLYKLGHRDARHAAAEAALSFSQKYGDLLDSVLETYVVAMVDDGEIIIDVASSQAKAEEIVLTYAKKHYDYEGDAYDASDISEELGAMGASMTWTIKKKMNPHFMEVSTDYDDEADNTFSIPTP